MKLIYFAIGCLLTTFPAATQAAGQKAARTGPMTMAQANRICMKELGYDFKGVLRNRTSSPAARANIEHCIRGKMQ